MTNAELRAASDLLRRILARVEAGELTAPARVVARITPRGITPSTYKSSVADAWWGLGGFAEDAGVVEG